MRDSEKLELGDSKQINDSYRHEAGDKVLARNPSTGRCPQYAIPTSYFGRAATNSRSCPDTRVEQRREPWYRGILRSVGNEGVIVGSAGIQIRQTCSLGWTAFPDFKTDPMRYLSRGSSGWLSAPYMKRRMRKKPRDWGLANGSVGKNSPSRLRTMGISAYAGSWSACQNHRSPPLWHWISELEILSKEQRR
jgi:hypothetical protein